MGGSETLQENRSGHNSALRLRHSESTPERCPRNLSDNENPRQYHTLNGPGSPRRCQLGQTNPRFQAALLPCPHSAQNRSVSMRWRRPPCRENDTLRSARLRRAPTTPPIALTMKRHIGPHLRAGSLFSRAHSYPLLQPPLLFLRVLLKRGRRLRLRLRLECRWIK
jgi:hypothetical protein